MREFFTNVIGGSVYLIVTLVGLFLLFFIADEVYQKSWKLSDLCKENLQKTGIQDVFVESLWSRTLDDHFIAGWVLQPRELSKTERTAICHFKRNTKIQERIEFAEGNKLDKIKNISSSNMNPIVMIEWLTKGSS